MPLVVAQFVVFFFLSKRWVLNFPGGHHVLLLAVTCSATCGGLRRWFFLAVKWLSHSGLLGAILYPEKKVQKYWKPLKTGRISSSVCVVWVAAWQCWQIGCFFFLPGFLFKIDASSPACGCGTDVCFETQPRRWRAYGFSPWLPIGASLSCEIELWLLPYTCDLLVVLACGAWPSSDNVKNTGIFIKNK